MGPESEVFITLFKSTIYVFLSVAQGLNEIVMMTMVIMMITDFATFCYSPARMQEESPPTLEDRKGSRSKWWAPGPDESVHPAGCLGKRKVSEFHG
jgi:hypothetical protein